jgi:hypothetical protein
MAIWGWNLSREKLGLDVLVGPQEDDDMDEDWLASDGEDWGVLQFSKKVNIDSQ